MPPTSISSVLPLVLSLHLCLIVPLSETLLNDAVKLYASPYVFPSIKSYELKQQQDNDNNTAIDNDNDDDIITDGKMDSHNMVLLNTSRNSDLLFGEITDKESGLLLHCHAPYSVQWVFRGDSDPEFVTNTTSTEEPSGNISYSAYLYLGSRRHLNERDTGRYICTSVRNKKLFSYLYIFVTRAALFTNKGLETVYYTDNDDTIRIPCSLSEPRAVATLQKSENGVLKCPMNDSVRFDTKHGFLLNPKRLHNPEGTYLCIADYNNTFQIIKYNVMRDEEINNGSGSTTEQTTDEYEPQPNEPTQSPAPPTQQSTPPATLDPPPDEINTACANKTCGANAFCRVNQNGKAACKCQSGYVGNPYVRCKHKSQTTTSTLSPSEMATYFPPAGSTTTEPGSQEYNCETYDECPNDRACIDNRCQDPCVVNSICGPNTNCEAQYHTPYCKCKEGYEGDPYSTQESQQCEKTYCDPNPCGPNTVCKYFSGIISCSCKAGYATDRDGVCRPNQKNNISKPGKPQINSKPQQITKNVSTTSLSPGKECHYDVDCPDDKMCVRDVCENPCVNACGAGATCHTRNHFPRCVCPEGTTGDPFYKCVPLFSELLGTSPAGVAAPPLASESQGSEGVSNNGGNGNFDCGGRNFPCGPNTVCQASKDQFVCVCPNNYVGDPYSSAGCTKSTSFLKCQKDADCPHFMACLRHQGCVNPCNVRSVCQKGHSCVPFLHKPACLKTVGYKVGAGLPRDGLASEGESANNAEEIADSEKIPAELTTNSSGCVVKSGSRGVISACGENSICYEASIINVSDNQDGDIFCGCMENHLGDPYVSCTLLRHCTGTSGTECGEKEICLNGLCKEIRSTNSTSNVGNSIPSGNPCSPSPCLNSTDICKIVRSNNSAICVPLPSYSYIAQSPPELPHFVRSDPCKHNGTCGDHLKEVNEEMEEDIQSTTDSQIIITNISPTLTSKFASLSSIESDLSSPQNHHHFVDTYSREAVLPLSNEHDTVIDV